LPGGASPTAPAPAGNAAAPASSSRPRPAFATLFKRLIALLIDVAIVLVLQTSLAAGFAPIYFNISPSAGPIFTYGQSALPVWPWTALFSVVYFGVFEVLIYATPGKLLAGLRVASREGIQPSRASAAARNILRPLDMIGNYVVGAVVVILNRRRQRLGDMAARTLVLDARALEWAGTTRTENLARSGAIVAALVTLAVLGQIVAYFHAPPLLPSATPPTSVLSGGQNPLGPHEKVRGVRDVATTRTLRSPGSARYRIRYSLLLQSGRRESCTGFVQYGWSGFPGGWLLDGSDSACRAS
jgi:uncharacterized RDD family membrane protein YckC